MQTQIQKNPNPNATIFVVRMVWFAMLSAVGSLYLIAYMDESKQEEVVTLSYAEIFTNQMVQMLFLQAVVVAGAAFFLPKVIGKKSKGNKLQKGFVGLIVRLALAESVTVFGLVGYFTVHTTMVMHPFMAISVLLILISFPTQELLEDFAS